MTEGSSRPENYPHALGSSLFNVISILEKYALIPSLYPGEEVWYALEFRPHGYANW